MIVVLIWMVCYERLHRITHIMVHTPIFKLMQIPASWHIH